MYMAVLNHKCIEESITVYIFRKSTISPTNNSSKKLSLFYCLCNVTNAIFDKFHRFLYYKLNKINGLIMVFKDNKVNNQINLKALFILY